MNKKRAGALLEFTGPRDVQYAHFLAVFLVVFFAVFFGEHFPQPMAVPPKKKTIHTGTLPVILALFTRLVVEARGFEPLTPRLPASCSPN